MNLHAYCKLRPCLWHLTTRENWIVIRKRAGDGGNYALASTTALHAEAESPEFELEEPRRVGQPLTLPWGTVAIRDQLPLVNAEKRLTFPEGWNLGRYCSWLSGFVFFWPGTADGPVTRNGKKHFRYYLRKAESKLTFLKIDAERLFARSDAARFAKVGSGAPASRRKVVELTPDIFLRPGEIGVPSDVLEVAFPDGLSLTADEVTPVSESRMREHLGLEE